MHATITTSRQFKIFTATALAALMITLLAVAFATDPAQAQDNTPTPQPCGPGEAEAFQPEPHEITTGHFALFDAYWRSTGASSGVLHTNLCPPLMATTRQDDGLGTITETTTRSTSNIDIDEAIMHVLDKHKVDVVATNAEATAGQLSLEEYPEVRKGLGLLGPNDEILPAPAGTEVWWLKLDDPDTSADETSDLSLGFSTALLDSDDWFTRAEGKPMRYKFEVQRHPAERGDDPHFYAYEAPKDGNAAQEKAVWDSTRVDLDDDDMLLDPGEYRALQWIFTKPGTYLLSVHLQGFVRTENPLADDELEYDQNWKRVSGNATETGEVKQYTIQVGEDLEEKEPPLFGVNLSVSENSPGGAKVGGPIPVYESEAGTTLTYTLGGTGSANFKAVAATDPHGAAPHAVQIVVVDGAVLDYEAKHSYDLLLSVTDGVDHENNKNPAIDDTLAVRIDLQDQAPGLLLYPDPSSEFVPIGETVKLFALFEPTPEQSGEAIVYQWAERIQEGGEIKWRAIDIGVAPSSPTWSVSKSSETVQAYRVEVVFSMSDVLPPPRVPSNDVQLRWVNINN